MGRGRSSRFIGSSAIPSASRETEPSKVLSCLSPKITGAAPWAAVEAKQDIAEFSSDLGTVRQDEGTLRVRFYTQFAQKGSRDDGVNRS